MFEDDKLYPVDDLRTGRDDVLRVLGSYSTLAQWRFRRVGPKFIKCGARVLYRGRDLNEWLDSQTNSPAVA